MKSSLREVEMIYYRVAFHVELAPEDEQRRVLAPVMVWKWRSTLLSSPHALFTLLHVYRNISQEHIRVFFASSEAEMDEMLERQNMGLLSSSIAADQLLSGNSINIQDVTRLALELSMEKDHDVPYFFALPVSLPERLAWVRLLCKVRRGELEA
jgi:hypothetical protein